MRTKKSAAETYHLGVDENGLGPKLGPMLVTAVLARVSEKGASVLRGGPKGSLAERLGDSKAMVSYGDIALAEAWARAIVERERKGEQPESPDALAHAISLDDKKTLRAPCPQSVLPQCWSAEGEAFGATEELVATLQKDMDALAKKGVEILAVRSKILCPKRLNEGLGAGKNRFVMDLHAMEELILSLQAMAGAEVKAVCGKVGGFGKYSKAFGPLGGRMHTVLEESRARSAYHFAGLGEIAFVRDADASDMLVSVASLVGKWMRELLMARIVRHWQRLVPGLGGASGYHDPVTAAFVKATEPARAERAVPEDCFERRGAEGKE